MSDLYRERCDSAVHDDTDNSTPEPVVPQCHDWHPDLVWYEKVEPTDRLCIVHGATADPGDWYCDLCDSEPCKIFDVARIET